MPEINKIRYKGTDYGIGGTGKENYSTEEQVIGTWIDGKPLYRKVIQGNFGSNTWNHNIENMDIAVSIKGIFRLTTSYNLFPLPTVRTNENRNAGVYVNRSQITFDLGTDLSGNSNYIFSLMIEYTKTTD